MHSRTWNRTLGWSWGKAFLVAWYLFSTILPTTSKHLANVMIRSNYWLNDMQDSADLQQIYIDTTNGALSYLTPASTPPDTFSTGAIVVNFLHLGQGTNLTSPIPGEDPNLYVNAGPGTWFPLLSILFSPLRKILEDGFWRGEMQFQLPSLR